MTSPEKGPLGAEERGPGNEVVPIACREADRNIPFALLPISFHSLVLEFKTVSLSALLI